VQLPVVITVNARFAWGVTNQKKTADATMVSWFAIWNPKVKEPKTTKSAHGQKL
jgi:hypothetical protein